MGAQMHDMTPVLAHFRARYPSAELRFREVFFSDPFGALRAGEVDAVTTWLPVREPDLTVGVVLREEPLRLMVGADHPLARQKSVSMEVLGDHIVPRLNGSIPSYGETAVLPARTPTGRPVRRGPPSPPSTRSLPSSRQARRSAQSPTRGGATTRRPTSSTSPSTMPRPSGGP
ncbi:LysR substrate-binding domain-containing protein [Streptomyces sp. NPDC057286]|uniref:LysR family transcriptional regulator substrate-binding protein n=2 Tax=Streptomyces TaxID=1883 RepID=UPI0036439C68